MDRLDRAANSKRPRRVDREQPRCGDGEQGPQPFAAADRGMAHRFVEPVAAVAGTGQQLGEESIDVGGDPRRLRLELGRQPIDGLNRHRRA